MRAHGFEHAQITAGVCLKQEVNIAHNEPSLLRSTECPSLSLLGIVDGRRASIELADFDQSTPDIEARITALRSDAESAPSDDANAVSSGEQAIIEQGPQHADFDVIRSAALDLLNFRKQHVSKVIIDECSIWHQRRRWRTLTSGGTDLSGCVGSYHASVVCVAREGKAASSFDFTGGAANDLHTIADRFGIGEMLRSTERQISTRPIDAPFVGTVVLAPNAVDDLIAWLLGQLGDAKLIAGTSLYRNDGGKQIASPLLSLKSRFSAPGVAAVSADAFNARPVQVLRSGELRSLLPTFYGSRKTGLPHVPVANDGWEIDAGGTTKAQLIDETERGALVGRLSMGQPASNGDFSGVIKNSFAIDNGRLSNALSETMISGNVARMLRDIDGISIERIDSGATLLPWMRVPGLHFS